MPSDRMAGFPLLVILVSEVMRKVRLPTVSVMALVFRPSTLPWKGAPCACLAGVAAVVSVLVPESCARKTAGAAIRLAATRENKVIFTIWLFIILGSDL